MTTNSNRGTAWVVTQIVLLVAIFLIPARIGDFVIIYDPLATVMTIAGIVILLIGLYIVAMALRDLGGSMSVFPKPVDDGRLQQGGIYRFVRHPMYSGAILSALGWSLFRTSVPALILTLILFVFFDRKAAHEETMLAGRYAGYAAYKAKTRKLIPFVY